MSNSTSCDLVPGGNIGNVYFGNIDFGITNIYFRNIHFGNVSDSASFEWPFSATLHTCLLQHFTYLSHKNRTYEWCGVLEEKQRAHLEIMH